MARPLPPLEDLTGAWDYQTLPRNVIIGEGCYIERRDSLAPFRSRRHPGLVLGQRVVVYTWAGFGVEEGGLLEVGNDCVLVGPLFMCANHIRLGERVVISYNVTVADCDFHPLNVEARRRDAVALAPGGDRSTRPHIDSAPVLIEDDAWIGIGATVLKGVTIGAGARVQAGSIVTSDVAAGTTVQGNPARPVGQ
jgi:acetyltransferase-like isoleucine patch superfamily enzyme